jgi:hypothetical protein
MDIMMMIILKGHYIYDFNTIKQYRKLRHLYPSGLPFSLSRFARELLLVVYRGFGVVNWVKVKG